MYTGREIFNKILSETEDRDRNTSKHIENQKATCYDCGSTVQGSILKYVKEKYPARSTECYKCEKTRCFACQCKNTKTWEN